MVEFMIEICICRERQRFGDGPADDDPARHSETPRPSSQHRRGRNEAQVRLLKSRPVAMATFPSLKALDCEATPTDGN